MIPEFSYANYVWSSYAIAMAVVLWQALGPMFKHRRLLWQLREDQLLEADQGNTAKSNHTREHA